MILWYVVPLQLGIVLFCTDRLTYDRGNDALSRVSPRSSISLGLRSMVTSKGVALGDEVWVLFSLDCMDGSFAIQLESPSYTSFLTC